MQQSRPKNQVERMIDKLPGRASVKQHEGNKYLRRIHPAYDASVFEDNSIEVDVYSVLVAFNVTCPATQHAIKKLLCAGLRSKGSKKDDLIGAMAALNRAIDLAEREDGSATPST